MDEPKILWQPSNRFKEESNLTDFIKWLETNHSLNFPDYESLWEWSVTDVKTFWKYLWSYFHLAGEVDSDEVLRGDTMPHIEWFPNKHLNYSEQVFKNRSDEYPALIFASESSEIKEISWNQLEQQVTALQNHLANAGVGPGDRVAAFLPNIPEAIISFLATNSLGAVWSSCSPDFGMGAVSDRFTQIKPKVLIAVDGYSYGGKSFDKTEVIEQLIGRLNLTEVISIPYLKNEPNQYQVKTVQWNDATSETGQQLQFHSSKFNDPIWILFSSGTTGIPKAITQSNGGIVLEHLKYLTFHNNIKPGDRCFWYTTTGWMMWNYIVSSLLVKGTVVLYDGSPGYPDMNVLWQFAEQAKINHFGTSAGFVIANMKAETTPGKDYNLENLISIGSTGSPLPPEGFEWLCKEVKKDLWVASISGGTDVCSAFVGGNPLWPVHSGEIQCRALGCKLEAYNEAGQPVLEEVGEMVVTKPMPSMPIYFWGDENFQRYKESYFEMFPGKWRHGDWMMLTKRKGIIIYGRSDSTLNRGGVRIGTSEIYRAVDLIEEVSDSLIICIENEKGDFYMPLFIVLKPGFSMTDDLRDKVNTTIRSENTPRHVPDEIIEIKEVPYTISGKKVETPVKKILQGKSYQSSLNKDALRNPSSLDFFIEFSKQINSRNE